MAIQSILFRRSKFTIPEAITWLRLHGHTFAKVDTTTNFYRFRQYTPRPGEKYRTQKITDGVEFVVSVGPPAMHL